ncbi:flagellar biosynthetic protein FliR, partial [Xanthomonas perforans]
FLLSSFASEFAPPVQRMFDTAFDAARELTA